MKKLLPLFLIHLALLANLILFEPELHAQVRWWPKFSLFKIHACTNPPKITCPPAFVACPGASTLPNNTGFAIGEPGGPGCNQPIVTYSDMIVSQGPCAGAIEINRIWTATDPQDPLLNSSCMQSIVLSDTGAPVITNCPPDITVTAQQNCKANVSWNPPSVTDNCGKLFLTVSHISGDVFPLGTTKVTYTAEDLCGNITYCSFNITVSGNCCKIAPTIVCPPAFSGCPKDSIFPDQTGTPTVTPGSVECAIPVVFYHDSILSTGPCEGAIKLVRNWTARDPFDTTLVVHCKQNIELIDKGLPSLSNCPTDVTVSPGVDCKAMVNWNPPVASDLCGIKSLVATHPPGSLFSEGNTKVEYVATDHCGNTISCSFSITVTTCCQVSPIITCPTDYKACPGTSTDPMVSGFATATKGQSGCADPIVSYADSISLGKCPGTKRIIRIWTATDPNNALLKSNCVQLVELKDDSPPSFTSCPSNLTVYTNTTDCKATVSWSFPTATDDCAGAVTPVGSHTSGSVFPVGITKVVYVATDGCGNAAEHSFTITVLSNCCNKPPVINCPPDYLGCPVLQCGPNVSGEAKASPSDPSCGTPILSYRDSLLNIYSACPNAKKFIRIWKATDPNDPKLYSECRQLIELNDRTPPVWNSCPANITVDAWGACEITVNWTPPTATDNCGGFVQITSNYVPGQKFTAGIHHVVYTARDACGNYINHSFTITVLGAGLKITCPADIVVDRIDPNLPGAYVNWNHPTVQSCGSCKDSLSGFIYMGTYNGSKYFCSRKPATWTEAKRICELNGGMLAVMNSPAENNYVASKLMGATAYIGLHDRNVEGFFEWVDNSPLSFTNWYPGQPNNANGDQDYGELLPDGTWNDQYNDCLREFICEVPCYEIKQIAGPPCGSLFPCGTTKVTYVATQGGYHDTCSFTVTVKCQNNGNYCESRGQWSNYTWIQKVSLGNLYNNSGNNGGYAYFPSPCNSYNWGKTYNLCLTPGFGGPNYQVYWKVWIDYNADGDFYDADELVAYGTGTGVLCGNITIPGNCNCPTRSTRMRVSMAYGGYPSNPCCTFSYGEVEDYCVIIQPQTLTGNPTSNLKSSTAAEQLKCVENCLDVLSERSIDSGADLGEVTLEPNNDLLIFPNPAREELQIKTFGHANGQINVFDARGRLVYTTACTGQQQIIDVRNWSEGYYLLSLDQTNGTKMLRKFAVIK
ncbi:MAG: HYR domain-containing protein [Saprospiraceae bacterium]|nr:HYR domain-containing protein [Candidatus Vicinibacter affinis]